MYPNSYTAEISAGHMYTCLYMEFEINICTSIHECLKYMAQTSLHPHKLNTYAANIIFPEHVVQVHFKLRFITETNAVNFEQTAPLQYDRGV